MNERADHYFSPSPSGDLVTRAIEVTLAGEPRTVISAGNVFSPDHVDRGTQILLQHLPVASEGPVLDLGCGWGPIALDAALAAPHATVWAVDVNERARHLTRENAERLGLTNVVVASPDEVPGDLEFRDIRSNPPIRIGKAALHDLLRTWLPRLAPGGAAYLVVAKHLGAESLQRWIDAAFPAFDVGRLARSKGFHIIEVRRASS